MGWLIVEDLVIVIALVILPLLVIQPGATLDGMERAQSIGWTLFKVAAFTGVMLVVGAGLLPWLLVRIAHTRSRELFTLGVLAIALGIAWIAYQLFHSFALGAFLAGLVLNSSPLGHNAAERSLPLRDAFAVLFFVLVGMLFDPTILLREPLAVLGVPGVVIVGKSIAALAITTAFRLDKATSLTVAAGPWPRFHPRRPQRAAGRHAAGDARPHPGRRPAVDLAQPVRLRPDRPDGRPAEAVGERLGRGTGPGQGKGRRGESRDGLICLASLRPILSQRSDCPGAGEREQPSGP